MKAFKSDLAALDRKITADLTPKHETVTNNSDGEEIKPTTLQQQPTNITPPQTSKEQEDKPSLVAEPQYQYQIAYPSRSTYRTMNF